MIRRMLGSETSSRIYNQSTMPLKKNIFREWPSHVTDFIIVKSNTQKTTLTHQALTHGIGQLSLVEHSLCPLSVTGTILRKGFVHESRYQYSDHSGRRRTARVRIACPLGLTATDEFYLWGLLAMTLSQDKPEPEFHATPHYCLRQLGIIDQHSRRGGRQYGQFAESLSRLAAVNYQNDGFYDPVRKEHRRVSFGFLSYSLPLSNGSSRAWRLAWNPVFFEFAAVAGGYLRFDLELYRNLDPAARRLYLFLCKLFCRKDTTPRFDLQYLGVQVLGFAPTLARRDLKIKVRRVIHNLIEQRLVADSQFTQSSSGSQRGSVSVVLKRGEYFQAKRKFRAAESPLVDLMRSIGVDEAAIARCLKRFPTTLLQEWLDITLAARERNGDSYFNRSPAAYFIDNVQKAAQGTRTPPDWWQELRRQERRAESNLRQQKRAAVDTNDSLTPLESVTQAIFSGFRELGQPEGDAHANAQRFAESYVKSPQVADPAALLRLLK